MRRSLALVVGTVVCVAVAGAVAGLAYVMATGLSAGPRPGTMETRVARAVRSLAIPRNVRDRGNPVAVSPPVIDEALAHFADHCAICHANDGSGSAEIGAHLFPRPPDMRAGATQDLTDGELFYIIEHGVRFTGMPAFGTGDAEGEQASWALVHFIRRLPHLSDEDLARMAAMNPRSPQEIRQEIEDEQFLSGGPATSADHTHHEGGQP